MTYNRPTVLVIQPDLLDDLGRFEAPLHQVADIDLVQPSLGDAVPAKLHHDALVVLGGDMGANDDAEYGWLLDICELIRQAADQQRPTLGICLGAQLIGRALGGRVEVGQHGYEVGVVEANLLPTAEHDELFGGLDPQLRSAAMHHDTISVLPPESTLLATGSRYTHQAFRVGACVWGVQFHPEASPEHFGSWVKSVEQSGSADTEQALLAQKQVEQQDAEYVSSTTGLLERFAQIVARS